MTIGAMQMALLVPELLILAFALLQTLRGFLSEMPVPPDPYLYGGLAVVACLAILVTTGAHQAILAGFASGL